MENIELNILKEFSYACGGRYRRTGKRSAEELYETLLCPKFQKAIDSNVKLVVYLDGTAGYAASFLDELFAQRLAREFGVDRVLKNLEIVSFEEPYLDDDIRQYIREFGEDFSASE